MEKNCYLVCGSSILLFISSLTGALECFTDSSGHEISSCQKKFLLLNSPSGEMKEFCSISHNFSSLEPSYHCEDQGVCSNFTKSKKEEILFLCKNRHLHLVFCCNSNLCNDHSKLSGLLSNNSTQKLCYRTTIIHSEHVTTINENTMTGSSKSPSGSQISETNPVKSVDSGDVSILEGSNICPIDDSTVHAFNGNCLNVTLPDGRIESRCILPMINCTNKEHQENEAQMKASTNISTATTTTTTAANQHPHPSKNILDNKNGVSIGFIIGAILVVTSGIVLIGVGAKKCYEKHVNSRSEYNYAQLTMDMNGGEEDDDERLILP